MRNSTTLVNEMSLLAVEGLLARRNTSVCTITLKHAAFSDDSRHRQYEIKAIGADEPTYPEHSCILRARQQLGVGKSLTEAARAAGSV